MQRYEPSLPRGTLGALALAMTAVTMMALVFAPAGLDVVDANGTVVSRVTPSTLIHKALAVVTTEAVNAGRTRPSSTRNTIRGKS